MEKITVDLHSRKSDVLVGECLGHLDKYIDGRKNFIITDKNLDRLYRKRFPSAPVFVVEPGEKSKSLETLAAISRWMLEQGADRSSFITGIGGGVVCDLAGFVASTYMRGIGFGFVATSLLAQVDASIGGKNGVNLDGYKNIIGNFTQPEFVICDVDMLLTLPENEFVCGMAEVIKHALIEDKDHFEHLGKYSTRILSRDRNEMEQIVAHSVAIKAAVVERDEREQGERRKLNLGHTWGHAVETVAGLPHGEAVAVGLAFAAGLSVSRGSLTEEERERIIRLLGMYELPVETRANPADIFDVLVKDKKREAGSLWFILMNGIGNVSIEAIGTDELKNYALNGT
ncbi:MAG: 3-dehydroquinate synthase [Marinilabiliales bacterium]|nr:MAG: 3-dehydroquinate synthase [Marinilabiliales bacterium]